MYRDFGAWALGFIVLSPMIAILMIGHHFPKSVSLSKPVGIWGWFRMVTLWLWILLLMACILPAITDGDEGMVLSCTAAIPVIILALSASCHERKEGLVPTARPTSNSGE